MPKGPAPKGEYSGKSSVFSTRIRPDLRQGLEKAAKQSGRSLSQEVEFRLRRSFVEDDRIADAFGDRQTYRLMRMMADAIHIFDEPAGSKRWTDNPVTFHLAQEAVIAVLARVAPKDDLPNSVLSGELQSKATKAGGQAIASFLWRKVQLADPALPLQRGTAEQAKNSVAKHDLALLLARTKNAALDLKVLRDLDLSEIELDQAKAELLKKMRQTEKDEK